VSQLHLATLRTPERRKEYQNALQLRFEAVATFCQALEDLHIYSVLLVRSVGNDAPAQASSSLSPSLARPGIYIICDTSRERWCRPGADRQEELKHCLKTVSRRPVGTQLCSLSGRCHPSLPTSEDEAGVEYLSPLRVSNTRNDKSNVPPSISANTHTDFIVV